MIVVFNKDGTVRHPHTDKVLGGWKKVPRTPYFKPENKQFSFKVWANGEDPLTAKEFYPRYYAERLFEPDYEKLEKSGFLRTDSSGHSCLTDDDSVSVRPDAPGYYTLIIDGQEREFGDIDDILDAVKNHIQNNRGPEP